MTRPPPNHPDVPPRLRPTVEVPREFGFELQIRGVPTDKRDPSEERRRKLGDYSHEVRYFVPPCCAEVLKGIQSDSLASRLKLETIARLAADVYFEEVKNAPRVFEYQIRDRQTIEKLAAQGKRPRLHPRAGKFAAPVYRLTTVEAEELGLTDADRI